MGFDINKIRNDFPILQRNIYNKPLVYMDNGATTHKPQCVIDNVNDFHSQNNSSIHRGIHYLSEQATEAYEGARKIVKDFINARNTNEIVFTSGATGSINTLAFSFGERYIKEGDEIIVSEMEHHSNIVPWQMLCERKGASLKVAPFTQHGELDLEAYKKLFSKKTRLVTITHVSNSLGTVNPVKDIIDIAHKNGVKIMLDGAQAIQHMKVDVQALDCDFYVFSGHKVFGPTGIGVLYGKEKLLYEMPPYQGGGDMVDCVTFEKTTYNELPFKFEAGTTNFIGAIGLGKALEYVESIGLQDIHQYEQELFTYANQRISSVDGIRIYGNAAHKVSIFSFLLGDIHMYDAGMILDKMGIAVRTGTHCTQPVMDHFEITGTIRASMVMYNTKEEVDLLCEALNKVKQMF